MFQSMMIFAQQIYILKPVSCFQCNLSVSRYGGNPRRCSYYKQQKSGRRDSRYSWVSRLLWSLFISLSFPRSRYFPLRLSTLSIRLRCLEVFFFFACHLGSSPFVMFPRWPDPSTQRLIASPRCDIDTDYNIALPPSYIPPLSRCRRMLLRSLLSRAVNLLFFFLSAGGRANISAPKQEMCEPLRQLELPPVIPPRLLFVSLGA